MSRLKDLTGLKLTGYITWSWFWVLSPVIIPTIIALTLVGLLFSYKVFIE